MTKLLFVIKVIPEKPWWHKSHLEYHSYSLGPKDETSADDYLEIVKPCTELQKQLVPDCGDIIVESGVEANKTNL
jgi:hypothetical protein